MISLLDGLSRKLAVFPSEKKEVKQIFEIGMKNRFQKESHPLLFYGMLTKNYGYNYEENSIVFSHEWQSFQLGIRDASETIFKD